MESSTSFSYEPLATEQVRWYWNKQPFNLAAVHQLDVQSRSQLTRYCEEDSNALEKEYRYHRFSTYFHLQRKPLQLMIGRSISVQAEAHQSLPGVELRS